MASIRPLRFSRHYDDDRIARLGLDRVPCTELEFVYLDRDRQCFVASREQVKRINNSAH